MKRFKCGTIFVNFYTPWLTYEAISVLTEVGDYSTLGMAELAWTVATSAET